MECSHENVAVATGICEHTKGYIELAAFCLDCELIGPVICEPGSPAELQHLKDAEAHHLKEGE